MQQIVKILVIVCLAGVLIGAISMIFVLVTRSKKMLMNISNGGVLNTKFSVYKNAFYWTKKSQGFEISGYNVNLYYVIIVFVFSLQLERHFVL